jgi:hypothetical protein
MKRKLILHVPHSSDSIPIRDGFLVGSIELEKEILKYYARGCEGRPSYRDLDTKLYEAFNTLNGSFPTNQFNSETYMCNKPNKLYMIDNAAALNTKRRKNCVFCPLTSVFDGMGQCTLGSQGDYNAEPGTNIEQDNMNFSVQLVENNTDVAYYKGKLELTQNPNPTQNNLPMSAKYTINYKGFRNNFPNGPNINIETKLDINSIQNSGKIKELEAHNVLKNTLVAILKFIVAQYNGNFPNIIAEYLTSGDDVFSNIVNIITEDEIRFNNTLDVGGEKIIKPNLNDNYDNPENTPDTPNTTKALNDYLLNTFFKILGKGAGDIFQEINSICKHGGYTGEKYYKSPSIIKWDNDGNAIRFFAANDRPSACRFMFLTWFGNDADINTKSLGGYIPENDENRLIVQKISTNPDYNLCSAVGSASTAAAAGGGKANTKNRKQSHKHSRKPHKKTKKHKKMKHPKRTKKYSQSKKHKKTKKRKHG